jgi:hypothetical protein
VSAVNRSVAAERATITAAPAMHDR